MNFRRVHSSSCRVYQVTLTLAGPWQTELTAVEQTSLSGYFIVHGPIQEPFNFYRGSVNIRVWYSRLSGRRVSRQARGKVFLSRMLLMNHEHELIAFFAFDHNRLLQSQDYSFNIHPATTSFGVGRGKVES